MIQALIGAVLLVIVAVVQGPKFLSPGRSGQPAAPTVTPEPFPTANPQISVTVSPTGVPRKQIPTPTLQPTVTPVRPGTPSLTTPIVSPPAVTPTVPTVSDTTPPVIQSMTGPADGSTVEFANFCFPMYITDNVSRYPDIRVRTAFDSADFGGWTTDVAPCFNNVANGTHAFKVQAKDAAGNESSTLTRTFTVSIP